MKIGIEATSAVASQKAGVGYYTYYLIRALALLRSNLHLYTLYVRDSISDVSSLFGIPHDMTSRLMPKVMRFPYLWAQLRLPVELKSHPQDVYFFPRFNASARLYSRKKRHDRP